MKKNICYGAIITEESFGRVYHYQGPPTIVKKAGKHALHYYEAFAGVRPEKVKRIRMTCPVCKRRLLSSIRVCHDGCCIYHTIPPHKPKGWWKKSKKNKR